MKAVTPQGSIEVEELVADEHAATTGYTNSVNEENQENIDAASLSSARNSHDAGAKDRIKPLEVDVDLQKGGINLTNGVNSNSDSNSPHRANETITSSIGDITVDSVRDHLNATTTTLCTTTTEETVGKQSFNLHISGGGCNKCVNIKMGSITFIKNKHKMFVCFSCCCIY